jgi:uncharacterized protein YcfJ
MAYRKAIVSTMTVLLVVALLASCARYRQQVVPFKMPQAYANSTTVGGAVIASRSWDDQKEAQEAFGFDIRPEILPVQVVFDNRGSHPLEIVSEQTFLIDVDQNAWPVMDARMAYDRIARKTEMGEVAPNAAKYGAMGAVAGGIIGAAIGIVGGSGVGDAAMKGAAAGAATGAVLGGSQGMSDTDVQRQIREDLRTRSLERRAVAPQEIAYGFVFFPGEAKKPQELRLRLREADTGRVYPPVALRY